MEAASSPPKEGEDLTTTKGKEDVIPALLSAGKRYYAYLGSAAFMILVLAAVAFALTRGDDQSTASQEEPREPTASSAAAPDDQEGEDAQQSLLQEGDEQSADDEGDGRSLNEEAGLPHRGAQDQEAARVGRTEQDQSDSASTQQGQAALPPGGGAEGDGEAGWVAQTGQTRIPLPKRKPLAMRRLPAQRHRASRQRPQPWSRASHRFRPYQRQPRKQHRQPPRSQSASAKRRPRRPLAPDSATHHLHQRQLGSSLVW